jgi:hypothetical protein
METMGQRSFEEMGIPPGYGFKQLLFSPVANAVVLQTCPADDAWRPERLYFRLAGTEKYTPIGEPAYLVSQESPFVHPSKPLVAYNLMEHKFSVDVEGREMHSGHWHSLEVASLETGLAVLSTHPETLRLPRGFHQGWICEVVAFGDSGVFVKVGLSKHSNLMEYFIAELDEAGALKPIAELPACFM